MKISAAALSLLALAGSSSAQYFSAGWKPGQKAPAAEPEVASFVPGQSSATAEPTAEPPKSTPFSFSSLSSLFDINNLLTSEPAVGLFKQFGINITERVQSALHQKIWDERVELITDDNFNDLIVNEQLTPEQEKDRVWILVITVTSSKQEGISKYMDQVFDSAFNETQLAGDLPNVKWGRIDYLNVTHITTKWGIWQAPYLVIVKDRGQTLRFYRHYQLRLRDDALREFLKAEGWKLTPPWSSSFAPGGDNEYIMDFLAVWFTKIYNVAVRIPKWILLLVTGSIGSLLIGLLHKPSKKDKEAIAAKEKEAAVQQELKKLLRPTNSVASGTRASTSKASSVVPATDSERESSATPAKRSSARQRKNKK